MAQSMNQTTAHAVVNVIDDQDAVRDALAEMLRVFGYSVCTFASADAFLASLTGDEAGCIVADVRMPGIDGIELVRELKRRGSALPVVACTGPTTSLPSLRQTQHRHAGNNQPRPEEIPVAEARVPPPMAPWGRARSMRQAQR